MQTLLHQGPTLGLSAYPLIEIERFPSLYDRSQLNVKISNIANPFRSFVGVISPRALSEKIRDIIFSTFFRKNGTHSKKLPVENRVAFSKILSLSRLLDDSGATLDQMSDVSAPILSQAEINYQAEQMLDLHGNAVLRLAYSYLHNMSDAEDILQESLIQFLKTAPTLESSAHEKAWMLRVAANLSKNRINYNKIRMTDELNEELIAEEKEDLSFVWDAVKQLPEKYREVIHLYHQENYSTKEIAQILSRNESTIRSDFKRSREKLKEILKEVYDFE